LKSALVYKRIIDCIFVVVPCLFAYENSDLVR
jgi:hypothetical protein